MEIERRSENFKKHIGTVHIGVPLTLLQRKIFNVLLINAYPELLDSEKYTINTSVFCELLGYDSNDIKKLEQALVVLTTTKIEWTVFDNEKKEKEWGVTTFLSGGIISGSKCTYSYSPFLKEKLYKPDIYAKINLKIQKKFSSRYALALYENCIRYKPNKDFKGSTGEWSFDQFRKLMGVSNVKLYLSFKELNRRIIKPSIEEINKNSDITIHPLLIKNGRKYEKIKFIIEFKDNFEVNFERNKEEIKLINHPLIEKYANVGIPKLQIVRWLNKYGEDYLKEKFTFFEKQLSAGNIKKSTGGFLVNCIQKDWKDDDPKVVYDKKEMYQRNKRIEIRNKEEEKIQKEKEVQIERRNKVKLFYNQLPQNKKDEIMEEFYESEIKNNKILIDIWKKSTPTESKTIKVLLQNYIYQNYININN